MAHGLLQRAHITPDQVITDAWEVDSQRDLEKIDSAGERAQTGARLSFSPNGERAGVPGSSHRGAILVVVRCERPQAQIPSPTPLWTFCRETTP